MSPSVDTESLPPHEQETCMESTVEDGSSPLVFHDAIGSGSTRSSGRRSSQQRPSYASSPTSSASPMSALKRKASQDMKSPTPSTDMATEQPKKRKQVKNACVNCQKACKKCDNARPCPRCVKYGIEDTCVDSVRKERKKGVKRGPYKAVDDYLPSKKSDSGTPPRVGRPRKRQVPARQSMSSRRSSYAGSYDGQDADYFYEQDEDYEEDEHEHYEEHVEEEEEERVPIRYYNAPRGYSYCRPSQVGRRRPVEYYEESEEEEDVMDQHEPVDFSLSSYHLSSSGLLVDTYSSPQSINKLVILSEICGKLLKEEKQKEKTLPPIKEETMYDVYEPRVSMPHIHYYEGVTHHPVRKYEGSMIENAGWVTPAPSPAPSCAPYSESPLHETQLHHPSSVRIVPSALASLTLTAASHEWVNRDATITPPRSVEPMDCLVGSMESLQQRQAIVQSSCHLTFSPYHDHTIVMKDKGLPTPPRTHLELSSSYQEPALASFPIAPAIPLSTL